MSITGLLSLVRGAVLAGLVFTVSSCSTKVVGNGATIYKVTPYHLKDINASVVAADPSIPFERQYVAHGAIHYYERAERQGNYYTVFWGVSDRSQPVKVRFDYRQKNTGLTIKTIEQEVTDYDGYNVTKFALIGDSYVLNGPVTSWRASVVRGSEVLASYKSYLWE